MRGINNKTKAKAELIAAGRLAWFEAEYNDPSNVWPYSVYKGKNTLEWRLSNDIVDSYYGE